MLNDILKVSLAEIKHSIQILQGILFTNSLRETVKHMPNLWASSLIVYPLTCDRKPPMFTSHRWLEHACACAILLLEWKNLSRMWITYSRRCQFLRVLDEESEQRSFMIINPRMRATMRRDISCFLLSWSIRQPSYDMMMKIVLTIQLIWRFKHIW